MGEGPRPLTSNNRSAPDLIRGKSKPVCMPFDFAQGERLLNQDFGAA